MRWEKHEEGCFSWMLGVNMERYSHGLHHHCVNNGREDNLCVLALLSARGVSRWGTLNAQTWLVGCPALTCSEKGFVCPGA